MSTHFQEQQCRSKRIYRKRVALPPICQPWIRTAAGGCSDNWHLQTRTRGRISSQGILGEDIREKLRFPGMIMSVPCVINKMTPEPPRESSVLVRENSVQAGWSQQPSALSWSPLVLAEGAVPGGFALSGDPLDKHSYTGLKLGSVAPSSQVGAARSGMRTCGDPGVSRRLSRTASYAAICSRDECVYCYWKITIFLQSMSKYITI